MKIVEQVVQMILAIAGLRKVGETKKAREQIQIAARYFLKTDIDLLPLYDNDQILNQFTDFNHHLETQKCILCADLLYELALIEESEKKTKAALRLKMLCLYLYTTALPNEQQFQDHQHFKKVSTLIEELKGKPVFKNIQNSLESYELFLEKHGK